MESLLPYQYVLIGLTFMWSGFVRSGLGFGGAVLALPLLLLIVDDPLIFLPIIAVQLIVFSFFIMRKSHKRLKKMQLEKGTDEQLSADNVKGSIDWKFLFFAMKIMIIPKIAGLLGLLNFPPKVVSTFIFSVVLVYAIGYVINRPFKRKSKAIEAGLLVLGGYVSGSSLTGAPLIIPVFAANVARHQLRDTLFVVWLILTIIKLASFIYYGVDLQLIHHLWLLPCAFVGHLIGEYFHSKIVAAESKTFFRVMGSALIVVSLVGLWKVFFVN